MTLPSENYNRHAKPYWSAEIKYAHTKSRTLRRLGILEGRPGGNEFKSYSLYKTAKANFRRLQRLAAEKYIEQSLDEIERASETDYRFFLETPEKKTKKAAIYLYRVKDS